MNFLKRATTSIIRRPGKSAILLIIIFILGSVIAGAISVAGAIDNTEANLRRGMRPIVSFDLDEEALMREMEASGQEHFDLMTLEMVRAIGALSYVAEYNYSIFTEFSTSELMQYGNGGFMIIDGEEVPFGWFRVRGTSHSEPLEMRENFIELTAGTPFSSEQLTQESDIFPILISSGLAEENDLMIGSTFTIDRTVYRPIMDGNWNRARTEEDIFAQMIFEFEVVGLFDPVLPDGFVLDYSDEAWQVRNRVRELNNQIHIPNFAAEIMQRFELDTELAIAAEYWGETESPFGEDPQLFQTVMLLHDVDDLESFRVAAEALMPDMWYVADLSNSFAEISTSMVTLQEIADWILIVSIGATLLILSLLITLFLKDRRHEMGVYLALGEKKVKVVVQMLIEVLVTAVVGMTLAIFVGHFVSNAMSDSMLRNDLAASNENWNMGWGGTGLNFLTEMGLDANTLTADEMMEAFDVSPSIETIGIFYAVGLGVVVISTMIPVLYIVALKPKKVLM